MSFKIVLSGACNFFVNLYTPIVHISFYLHINKIQTEWKQYNFYKSSLEFKIKRSAERGIRTPEGRMPHKLSRLAPYR